MKKSLKYVVTSLVLCLSLSATAMAAEQKIVANDETYGQLLQAILSQTEDQAMTVRLESDVTLSSTVVIGSSDYNGIFNGEVMTVASHDITLDLNGYTLTGAENMNIFQVQDGYQLTITDQSSEKDGSLIAQGAEAVMVEDGAVYLNTLEEATDEPDTTTEAKPENPFTDVKESNYFYDPVLWAVEQNITSGTSSTTFSPEQTCTRSQIIAFLWRAAASPEPTGTNPFTDVKEGAYYEKAATWAAEQGMVSGTEFKPNDPCTRLMAIEFMWKQAGSPEASETVFTDVSSDAVDWAVETGVTSGTSDTTFSPDQICTRGQIVTFLYRAFA